MFTLELLKDKTTTIFLLSLLSFCIAMLVTPIFTHYAFKYKLWKKKRDTAVTGEKLTVIASLRMKRDPVPLMAGLITVFAVTAVTVVYNLERSQTWLPLAALLGGGAVGLMDDILNIIGKGGLRARLKFVLVTLVGVFTAWFFYYKLGVSTVHIASGVEWKLGLWIIPLFTLAVVSTGNAVNISDGMDGLAGGLLLSAYGSYALIAFLQGSYGIAGFCMTVVGALLSYLWFNIPPARFFMGDVGSFSLGTALGVIAMLTNTVVLLPLIGFVFVLEAGSTLIQIFSKKVFHRKIFIAAPIHHHFEASGWPKAKVTMRFWVIGQVCAALGVILALIGGYIK
jgi:phospho-N-acetylmuramoyl-pentapeptide-transferase